MLGFVVVVFFFATSNVVHEPAEFNNLHCSNSCNIFGRNRPFKRLQC